jgi:hypothetical protein
VGLGHKDVKSVGIISKSYVVTELKLKGMNLTVLVLRKICYIVTTI